MAAGEQCSQTRSVTPRSRILTLTAVLAALTAVGAYLQVPFPPVPFTLQTLFVYVAGLLLPPLNAVLSQVVYLALGFAGVPVFAGGRAGVGVVYTPTFGYLLAFVIAAWVVSLLSHRPDLRAMTRRTVAVGSGAAIVLVLGSLYLWVAMRWFLGTPLPFWRALWIGGAVFVPVEVLKAVVAIWLAGRVQRALRV